MLDEETIKKRLSELLDEERFNHSLSVEKTALELALHHCVPEDKARIAGYLHDVGRSVEKAGFLKKAREFGIKPDEVENFQPKLLHSRLGAIIAEKDFNITDKEILGAIENHTSGRPGMSKLEQVVYLADHIEPGRKFKGVEEVRSLAYLNMDLAIAKSTTSMIEMLLAKNLPIHPRTIKTGNFYLIKVKDKNIK